MSTQMIASTPAPSMLPQIMSTTTNGFFDLIPILVSIIALVVSIATTVITYRQAVKSQRLSLEAEYFCQIFKKYLVTSIPTARECIHFEDEKIANQDELCRVVNTLRKEAKYFRFTDSDFYTDLKTQLQEIEDYLVDCLNHHYDGERQAAFFAGLDRLIESLYKRVTKRYYGA